MEDTHQQTAIDDPPLRNQATIRTTEIRDSSVFPFLTKQNQ